jgi:hypothetical protein
MPKHLESHRTFGGRARGVRQREGRRPIIHDTRSAWFVTSHKMLCDISQVEKMGILSSAQALPFPCVTG